MIIICCGRSRAGGAPTTALRATKFQLREDSALVLIMVVKPILDNSPQPGLATHWSLAGEQKFSLRECVCPRGVVAYSHIVQEREPCLSKRNHFTFQKK
jgi:hypothetical protein